MTSHSGGTASHPRGTPSLHISLEGVRNNAPADKDRFNSGVWKRSSDVVDSRWLEMGHRTGRRHRQERRCYTDYLTLRITSLICAIDATYQRGMGRAVGGIFTADGDTERVFRCVILAFLRHHDVLLLSFCRSLVLTYLI